MEFEVWSLVAGDLSTTNTATQYIGTLARLAEAYKM